VSKATGRATPKDRQAPQRLAESAVENAADLIGVPLKTDDLDGALATAIELGGAGDDLDKRTDEGLFDLSAAPGVPLVEDGEASTLRRVLPVP
jgi:hypothetical protein